MSLEYHKNEIHNRKTQFFVVVFNRKTHLVPRNVLFYRNNIKAVMSDIKSINLGYVYETVVAQELKARHVVE